MRLTNLKGLPKAIELAVSADPYSKGDSDMTVTGLLKPGQQQYLLTKHADELTEDVADRIYSLTGSAMHAVLERAAKADPTLIIETRYYLEVLGVKVGGQIDMFDPATGTLTDWKQVSVYAMKEGVKPDQEAQLNMQAALMRANGIEVKKLQIGAVYRDWSKRELLRSRQGDYPEKQAEIFTSPMWPNDKALSFIEERVKHHLAARTGDVKPCTAEERWAKPPTYAVKKIGGKKAQPGGLKATEAEALAMVATNPRELTYEFRAGESIRCSSYCPASSFCNQFKNMKKENE